jgi:hypothetical protein
MPPKSERVNFTFDPETLQLLRELAAKRDMSMSQVLRLLVREAASKKPSKTKETL